MASRTCPKCTNKSDDPVTCSKCGLNFADYEKGKLEKLGDVHKLLSEGRFLEAKQIAEKLPAQFPDKKTDFALLLSNINRDISILEKCDLAQTAYDEGDYAQACLLLRNIKAFDSGLNERVVRLRRMAERPAQDGEQFNRAVEAFGQGRYSAAAALFRQLRSSGRQTEVADYLQRIDDAVRELLKEVIDCINTGQFALAETRLAEVLEQYPDLQDEIGGYRGLLARRAEIRGRILESANRARNDQRLLEAKILYAYLVQNFPESKPQVLPQLKEIGPQTAVSLADLQESGVVNLAALGIDLGVLGQGQPAAAGNMDEDIPRDLPAAEITNFVTMRASSPATADEFYPPVEIDFEEIPDFIF